MVRLRLRGTVEEIDLRRCVALRVEGGTDQIMRNIISERVLGLPEDIRVDKGIAFKDIPTGSTD